MKWKDLSLKERKQIYDSVRVNNPGATYFDIKQQFDSIPAYEDGKDESVAASFSLPEVNIYPQNRFGDIARTQGYETAKNWKKVKEGTTAGINTFINSPHAQFVQTMLPLPDGLEHLGSGIKQVKQFIKSESDRYARNVYNNLMPMSYYSSYTGKNKLNEVKEAVKDYIKGKDPKDLNNPKWKEEAYKIFEDDYKRNPNRDSSFEMEPNMALEARMEAFQNYLKLPHEPKYFVEIDKNKRLFDINLDNVPKRNINNWLNNAAELNNNSSRVIIDKLVNTGGNVKMSKTPSSKKVSVYLPEFDAYTEYKDAVNFIEDLGKGDYTGAAMDAVLNLIPWGVGKGIKKLKSKVGRIFEGTEIDGASVHSFAPTQTKKKTKKKTEEDYDSEFSEV